MGKTGTAQGGAGNFKGRLGVVVTRNGKIVHDVTDTSNLISRLIGALKMALRGKINHIREVLYL